MNRWWPPVWALAMLFMAGSAMAAGPWSARLQSAHPVQATTPLSGMVAEITVQPGDEVAKGALLGRLDARAQRARLAQARAALAEQEALNREAQREFERAEELYDRTVLSDHERELSRVAMLQAEARFQAARADLVTAEIALQHTEVRSPLRARVLRQHLYAGQAAVSNSQAHAWFDLLPVGRMQAVVMLDPGDLVQFEAGTVREVVIDGARRAMLVLALDAEETGERFRATLEFTLPDDHRLHAGQVVQLSLP